MVIISKTILVKFGLKHTDAAEALNNWWRTAKGSQWKSFQDVRNDFGSVDYAGNDRYIFNIKGNKYRLVTMIFFDIRTV